MGFSFFFCEVVFCRFGPSSINEPNQNGPYVSLSHVIGPDVTEIPFRPNKSYSWARIPAAGRLSQAVAASFSTPAPPEAEHRGVAAAAAAAALQMRGGGGGRGGSYRRWSARWWPASIGSMRATGALSRLLMVPDPLALADLVCFQRGWHSCAAACSFSTVDPLSSSSSFFSLGRRVYGNGGGSWTTITTKRNQCCCCYCGRQPPSRSRSSRLPVPYYSPHSGFASVLCIVALYASDDDEITHHSLRN